MKELLNAAIHAAYEAGKSTLRYYQTNSLTVEEKSDASPVTIADREAEEWLREFIQKEFPSHGILGEEFGELPGAGEYRWILDPIDGTKSFIHGIPFYGTLIGIENLKVKDTVIGIVHIPALNQMYYAQKGQGAYLNGRKITARKNSKLSLATLLTTDIKNMGNYQTVFDKLMSQVKLVRTWGDCYGHMMVADGRADVMIDPKMNLWDVAALKPILEESGARIFDREGKSHLYIKSMISCTSSISERIIELLKET